MFRRSKSAETTGSTALKEGGKGRRTPTRKEAEAAARARAKVPTDRKEAAQQQRARRSAASATVREGMRTGDDRFLPTRDRGPVKRFVRDFVDSRICVAELLLPLLVVILVSGSLAASFSAALEMTLLLLVVLDSAYLVWRLRRELRRRFEGREDRSTDGAVRYALVRSLQLRWLRAPRRQVRLGEKLTGRY